jgi:hypothetical protein
MTTDMTLSTTEVARLLGCDPNVLTRLPITEPGLFPLPLVGSGNQRRWPLEMLPALRVWHRLNEGQHHAGSPPRVEMRRHAIAVAMANPEAKWILATKDGATAWDSTTAALGGMAGQSLSGCMLISMGEDDDGADR